MAQSQNKMQKRLLRQGEICDIIKYSLYRKERGKNREFTIYRQIGGITVPKDIGGDGFHAMLDRLLQSGKITKTMYDQMLAVEERKKARREKELQANREREARLAEERRLREERIAELETVARESPLYRQGCSCRHYSTCNGNK